MEWLLFVAVGGGIALGARRSADRLAARRADVGRRGPISRRPPTRTSRCSGRNCPGWVWMSPGVNSMPRPGATTRPRSMRTTPPSWRSTACGRPTRSARSPTRWPPGGTRSPVSALGWPASPVPVRRVPCFFNPQHGPSTTDVVWTRPRHGTRTVPACAQDAARVGVGQQPEIRYVQLGSRQVPYWEAGRAFAPYGQGYFASGGEGASFIVLSGFDGQSGGHSGWGDTWGGGGHDGGGHGGGGHGGGGHGGGGHRRPRRWRPWRLRRGWTRRLRRGWSRRRRQLARHHRRDRDGGQSAWGCPVRWGVLSPGEHGWPPMVHYPLPSAVCAFPD